MENTLDLSQSTKYDLIVEKDRTLSSSIYCTYYSGGTEYNYDLTPYTGATLVVKNASGTIIQTFNTSDGSITLGIGGLFKLIKSAEEMDTVRAGEYSYDMYLSSSTYPKRAFLRGKITYVQNTSN
jgi:hypothetical protein